MKKLISILVSMLLVLSLTVTGLAADGTFQGEGAGKGGMITVEVTVENGEIAAINVLSHGETPGFADALGTVSAAMIAANQVDVDGVTGATLSSNGLKAAVTAALAAAGCATGVPGDGIRNVRAEPPELQARKRAALEAAKELGLRASGGQRD